MIQPFNFHRNSPTCSKVYYNLLKFSVRTSDHISTTNNLLRKLITIPCRNQVENGYWHWVCLPLCKPILQTLMKSLTVVNSNATWVAKICLEEYEPSSNPTSPLLHSSNDALHGWDQLGFTAFTMGIALWLSSYSTLLVPWAKGMWFGS